MENLWEKSEITLAELTKLQQLANSDISEPLLDKQYNDLVDSINTICGDGLVNGCNYHFSSKSHIFAGYQNNLIVTGRYLDRRTGRREEHKVNLFTDCLIPVIEHFYHVKIKELKADEIEKKRKAKETLQSVTKAIADGTLKVV